MSMFDINDDLQGGSGARALAQGTDSHLVFSLSGNKQIDGLAVINRGFSLNRNDVQTKARVATSVLSTPESTLSGKVQVLRNDQVAAQLNFDLPAAGQIPPPTVGLTVATNAVSQVLRAATKYLRFTASFSDATGETQLSNPTNIWLGDRQTRWDAPYALLTHNATNPGANTLTTGPNRTVRVVPHDRIIDKEGAPLELQLSWPLGPFVGPNSSQLTANPTEGTIPEGTVIIARYAGLLPDGQFIWLAAEQSFVVSSLGGLAITAPAAGQLVCPAGSAGMASRVAVRAAVYWRLSTHTNWRREVASNSTLGTTTTINTIFNEGTFPAAQTSATLTAIESARVSLGLSGGVIGGSVVTNRVNFKLFSGTRQVQGDGATYTTGNQWPYPITATEASGSRAFSLISFTLSGGGSVEADYPGYPTGAPRGDEIFVANEKLGMQLTFPTRVRATSMRVFVQEFTSNDGATLTQTTVPQQLIYQGPPVTNWEWLGVVINPSATVPTDNTTSNYPANYAGTVNWSSVDDTIDVLPGDQVFCDLSTGSLSAKTLIQLSLPVTFSD